MIDYCPLIQLYLAVLKSFLREVLFLKQKVCSKMHKILMNRNFGTNTVFINFDERGVKWYVIYDGCPLR